MDKSEEKYILELSRAQVALLGHLVISQHLYQSTYEPLQELCKKIDIICKNLKK